MIDNFGNALSTGFANLALDYKYQSDQVTEDVMDGACDAHGTDETYVRQFSRKAWNEQSAWIR
jgi:hypothetical protein